MRRICWVGGLSRRNRRLYATPSAGRRFTRSTKRLLSPSKDFINPFADGNQGVGVKTVDDVLPAGTVLEGRYKIEKKLGEGGMGQVYLVTHTRLKKQFALKALMKISDDPEEQRQYLEQFEIEAQMLASLVHPSLAQVSDFFEQGGVHFLVMEYIDGRTLTDVVNLAPRPISQRRVLQWAEELLGVLTYLHSVDPPVIVRDLKPDNIMLSREGKLKLIDFGIAKREAEGKKTRDIIHGMGTAEYAPLEQYGQGSTDQRTDLYALGATLYFLLTDAAPPPAWRRASEGAQVPDPRPINPTITDGMWRALQKLMALSRDDRPDNAPAAWELLKVEVGKKPNRAHTAAPTPTPSSPSPSSSYGLSSQQIPQPKVAVAPAVRAHSRQLNLQVKESHQLQRYNSPIHSLAFSPTHGVLAVGSNFVHLWDLGRRKLWQKIWRGSGSYNCSVAFSSDGRWVAVGSHDATVRIFETQTGKLLRTLALKRRTFFTDKVRQVDFAYGSRFVGAVSDLSNLRVWDASNGQEKFSREWHHSGILTNFQQKSMSLCYSVKGRLVVGGADGTLSLYEAGSGNLLERIEGHSEPVVSLAYSPDGNFLVSGSEDRSAALWQMDSFRELQRFRHPSPVLSVSFSHDGRVLATGAGDCQVRLWDVAKGTEVQRLREHSGAIFSVAFSKARNFLATGSNDRTVRLWTLDW